MKSSRSIYAKVAVAAFALAAFGTASVVQARSDVFFSIGANVAPGVAIGVSNAPAYYPRVYAPVYAPPVYVQPAPVYYGYYPPAPVFVQPAFGITYYVPHVRHHRHGRHSHR